MEKTSEFSFSLVLKEKTSTYKFILGSYLAFFFLNIIVIYEKSKYVDYVMGFSVVYLLASQLFLDFRSLRIKEYKPIGSLKMNHLGLEVFTNELSFSKNVSQLKSLEFEINETSCDPKFRGDGVGLGILNKFKDGIDNTISFYTDEEKYYKFNFYIIDIQDINEIDSFLNDIPINFTLKRKGQKIKSIKEKHLLDFPPEHVNTQRKS